MNLISQFDMNDFVIDKVNNNYKSSRLIIFLFEFIHLSIFSKQYTLMLFFVKYFKCLFSQFFFIFYYKN